MRKLLCAGLLLAAPSTALAGFGTTGSLGSEVSSNGFIGLEIWPTFDFVSDGVILQFHVLELLQGLASEQVAIGLNGYIPIMSYGVSSSFDGTIQVGGTLDIVGDPFVVSFGATSRFGVETEGAMGLGLYVVPVVGITVIEDDLGLLTGGAIQLSVWVGGGGSSSSSSY